MISMIKPHSFVQFVKYIDFLSAEFYTMCTEHIILDRYSLIMRERSAAVCGFYVYP